MYCRIIRNDILKSKAITLLFVAVAALLVSLVAILIVKLSGAIDTLTARGSGYAPRFTNVSLTSVES
jgi:hypothetical protein